MEDIKKRKLDNNERISPHSEQDLRALLDPLAKSQLVDLLAKLGSQYSSIAEEIKGIATADPVHRKLLVRGLAWNTSSDTLCAAFSEYGEIEEGAVIYDKVSGKSRGYGFITYKYMESTHSALRAPSKLIDGRMVVCNLACEGLTGSSSTQDLTLRKLYIGGLSPNVTSEMLLHCLGRHGDIEEGSVAYDKDTNESRGFGFVTFKTVDAARKAIDDPQKSLGGRNVIVKLADSHKGRTIQTQLATPMIPMPLPLVPGYAQPGKAHPSTTPQGFGYPPAVGPYHNNTYSSPPIAPYPTQSQIPYPYYIGKQ
ncbi:hypothetical protein ACLB2K_066093 [Fragaria x ananassa]